jgi:hypothetical protein
MKAHASGYATCANLHQDSASNRFGTEAYYSVVAALLVPGATLYPKQDNLALSPMLHRSYVLQHHDVQHGIIRTGDENTYIF